MGMNNILKEPEGSPITLYNILQYNQFRCKGKQKDDELFIVYRDEKGNKKVQSIKNPPMEIYFVKPEFRNDFNTPREYYPIDRTFTAKVPARSVMYRVYDEIKKSTDPVGRSLKRVYDNAAQTGQWSTKKEIFKWPYTLFSDCAVEDYYWIQSAVHYDMTQTTYLDKCFADIENDIYGISSTEQQLNLDPVNACTLIFDFDKAGPNKNVGRQVYTYLLRNHKRYPQQKEFEAHLDDFYKECHRCFDKQTVIKKNKKKLIDVTADYHIKLFDTEQELLHMIFATINKFKPDVCEFWNMPYDMPKMKNRMDILGMDYNKEISDLELFPENASFTTFHIDDRPINISERNSYIRATTTTQYIDQMQNYAGIRKGRKSYGSNKLDNIAKIELGQGKWEFRKGIDVRNACIEDYWNFVLYNIRDVWSQQLIDTVTNDTMGLIYDMNQHNCPLYHLVKQTKYQKQIYYANYLSFGYVPGNNANVHYDRYETEEDEENANKAMKRRLLRAILDERGMDTEDAGDISDDDLADALDAAEDTDSSDDAATDDDSDGITEIAETEVAKAYDENLGIFEDSAARKLSLPGGLVGNPNNNLATGVELIDGIKSKHVYDDSIDEDYSSEYPWAKYTRSLSRSTQIGRLIIPHRISPYQNMLPLGQIKRKQDTKYYIPGAEFTADYLSQDYLSMSAVWFNLPLITETNDIIDQMLEGKSLDEIDAEKKESAQ